jgi:hypothetical protein
MAAAAGASGGEVRRPGIRIMHAEPPNRGVRAPPSRLPIADWENFAARRVESVWLAETGAAPENRVFLRTGKI